LLHNPEACFIVHRYIHAYQSESAMYSLAIHH
jgi:hypothetical protein